jgi:hypothetical protein
MVVFWWIVTFRDLPLDLQIGRSEMVGWLFKEKFKN